MEAVLPASTLRQLARRRREHKVPRREELLYPRMPDQETVHTLSTAVVRPSATSSSSRAASWTSAVKAPLKLSRTKDFGYTNPYLNKPPPKERVRRRKEVSSAPQKRQHQHKVSGAGHGNLTPVKAKVDSHWLKPHHHHRHHHHSNPFQHDVQPGEGPDIRRAKQRSLAGAHQELEVMLTRIERARDYLPPPPPPPTPAPKRRGRVPQVRAKAEKVEKVAKGVRRHMRQPPPVPPGSPMSSARPNKAQQQLKMAIPLVHNPQRLAPGKRDALLELLQRTEQHDRGIVDMVRSGKGGNRSDMRMMVQVLPLSLSESPYKRVWKGYGPLAEPQETPRTVVKDVKIQGSTNGQVFPSTQALKDEKIIQPLNERQEQAMRERAELDEHKQQVTICREQQRQREVRKQLAEVKKRQQGGAFDNGVVSPRTIRLKDPFAHAPIAVPVSSDPWQQLLQERDRFGEHCQRSDFYNDYRSPEPWNMYAKVASKLSSQLMDMIDTEFKRSLGN